MNHAFTLKEYFTFLLQTERCISNKSKCPKCMMYLWHQRMLQARLFASDLQEWSLFNELTNSLKACFLDPSIQQANKNKSPNGKPVLPFYLLLSLKDNNWPGPNA